MIELVIIAAVVIYQKRKVETKIIQGVDQTVTSRVWIKPLRLPCPRSSRFVTPKHALG